MCSALSFPPGFSEKKKSWIPVTLKPQRQSAESWWMAQPEWKGSSIQLCPPCTFYPSKTSRPVPPGLESLLFLWSLVVALVDQTGHRLERVSRWMDSRSCRTLNAQPTWGTGKSEDSHCRPSKTPSLKNKSPAPHVMHIKDPTLRKHFFF